MKNLNIIANELFNKVRGRFPSITIGTQEGEVTNDPKLARFFDFDFNQAGKTIGKVSISLTDESVSVMYNNDFITNEDQTTKDSWYAFLKELRVFARKRLLNFDTRDITKSNLNKRDYKFLSATKFGDIKMESKMYGTTRTSFQNFGNARLAIKHNESIDQADTRNRIKKIESIFIETNEGERFKYPYKHITGARAMARHVAEGGKFSDDFGSHIIEMSTELGKLKKFKSYVGRSSVMAETLDQYKDVIKDRIQNIKKTLENIQKPKQYKSFVENFSKSDIVEVPEDVKENWIDELTIKQFNEELADVFPYIYRLVSEATKAKEIGLEELDEASERTDEALPIILGLLGLAGAAYAGLALTSARRTPLGRAVKIACDNGDESACEYYKNLDLYVDTNDTSTLQYIRRVYVIEPFGDFDNIPESRYEEDIETAFEGSMGQFAEGVEMCPDACCGKPVTECSCGPDCEHCDCYEKNRMNAEGNEFAQKVQQMKAAGAKKGDKFKTSDGEEHTLEDVTEFVLSMYDRETGKFPKGETAVLTAIEKDFGESFINPAKKFIEAVNAKFEEYNGYSNPELMDDVNETEQQMTAVANQAVAKAKAGDIGGAADDMERMHNDFARLDIGSGLYDFMQNTIRDLKNLVRRNPNHPEASKFVQAIKELEAGLPAMKQAAADSRRMAVDAGAGRQDTGESQESADILKLAGL